MKNIDFNSSVERMKELINCGKNDASLKSNVSETVEYKVNAADGKTYGIVRECQRYFIKEECENGAFEYIGGIGNKSENEYPSYNSAFRNIELKVRSINEAKNNGQTFQAFEAPKQAEYIVEATTEMRGELDRVKQLMNNASGIMNEGKTEFITKPKFKDPEGFGTASDPEKQGEPFSEKPGEYKGDIDPTSSSKTPKNAGDPFEKEVKPAPEKMDIEKTNKKPCEAGKFGEPAKDVLGNSVATKKPSGGKVIKVTETQMNAVKKAIKEGYFDNDDDFYGDEEENPLLSKFNYPEINKMGRTAKPIPASIDNDLPDMADDYEENYDVFDPNRDLDRDAMPVEEPIQDELGECSPRFEGVDEELVNKITEAVLSAVEEEVVDEGFMDNLKAVGSVAKYVGSKAANSVKQGAQNMAQNVKQKVQKTGQDLSQQYNRSMQNSSAGKVADIASNLKAEIDNLNARTVKAGGQPLNYKSVLSTITNQLVGNKGLNLSKYKTESVEKDNLVKEITEAVLNAFGDHPAYQKAAFTTPSNSQSLVAGTKEWDDESVKGDKPYGQKIGDSAPFTEPVKQKVGEGEIGKDADEAMKGKTQQGLPSQGQKGDTKPFKKPVEKSGDGIAKGTPVQKGETQQGETKLGQKGDVQPFGKKTNKEGVKESFTKKDFLNRLAESIVNDLKKK